MTVYESRAVSYPGNQIKDLKFDVDIQPLQRERSDSLPEPRYFRQLRRALDIDSDLDNLSIDENVFLRSKEAKEWKSKRVTHKQLDQTNKADNVVISTEPVGSPTPVRGITSSPTLALTHIPWTNWTRWNYRRSKSHLY